MPQLKVGPVLDDRPVKRTIELPASIDRLLVDYAKVASEQAGASYKPEQLVPQMLQAVHRDRSRVHEATQGAVSAIDALRSVRTPIDEGNM